ncbi:hypothetical protein C7401_104134 [Paraburkholderia unamae]|nr:hypothetical protein C7401_104134 [Paraburkholderia unamae]
MVLPLLFVNSEFYRYTLISRRTTLHVMKVSEKAP